MALTCRFGIQGNLLGGTLSITNCEFRNLPGWSVADMDTSYGGPPVGGNELVMTSIVFADNSIHECNGTVALRGNHADLTNTVDVYGNTWTNIGGNFAQTGAQWAAIEVNHADVLNFYDNEITGVVIGIYGEGQALQMWDIGSVDMHDNVFAGNAQGVYYFAGGAANSYGGPYAIPGGSVYANTFDGNTAYGLSIDAAATGSPLDAENNWWGDTTGPADASGSDEADSPPCYDPSTMVNADGAGDAVSNLNVDYCPWLLAQAQIALVAEDDCDTDSTVVITIDLSDCEHS